MSGSALTSGPWVTERGLMLLTRQAPEHQPDHADLHLRLARPHVPLVVPAVDPASPQPRERPLHRPADRQRLEPRAYFSTRPEDEAAMKKSEVILRK